MPAYSISYELNSLGQSYQKLEDKIHQICSGYIKYVESSWLITYSGNTTNLYEELRKCIDQNDNI